MDNAEEVFMEESSCEGERAAAALLSMMSVSTKDSFRLPEEEIWGRTRRRRRNSVTFSYFFFLAAV